MLGAASTNEIIFVALLLVLVLIAPKVSRIGETLGGWLARSKKPGRDERDERSHPAGRGSRSTPPRRGDAPPDP
jgi:Sec-independent protein translocase protein TatA